MLLASTDCQVQYYTVTTICLLVCLSLGDSIQPDPDQQQKAETHLPTTLLYIEYDDTIILWT